MAMIGDPIDDEMSPIEDEFPLGDGAADTEGFVICPYCGESNELALDVAGGDVQEYVEDCQVCCRPWRVTVTYDESGAATVTAEPLEDD
jgi:cysteine-rich CPXCG protein